jgi:hypothetical protein
MSEMLDIYLDLVKPCDARLRGEIGELTAICL